ncbi:mitochondrial ribonuclease P protein 1 homolog [Phlebotomus argentipes]|uniref:mitochondrial ribonuclease P protein 1 homolog n=1 Tax=Phlebotomus argentipes TaxID=94469 RepID=UPI002893471D|nr:mitochondrial ribonuclease P protein 1 homolog [Phlebotomus argentipes]
MYNLASVSSCSARILSSALSRFTIGVNRRACSLQNVADDPETERMLKVLRLEVDVFRQEGRKAPDPELLKEEHWNHLLTLKTKNSRQKYYAYLWQIQMKRESAKKKHETAKAETLVRRAEKLEIAKTEEHIVYGLNWTTMFLRIYDSTINLWLNNRLTRAMQFAPKVVIDCSYEEYMSRSEASNCGKQLMLAFAENRLATEPFDLHFCSVDLNAVGGNTLKKFIPTLLDPDFPINVHTESHLDLFPKERLVYLTPHCRQELTAYNPDDIYIIGAMVDKKNTDPLSLAKAKRQGLRMAKLPLDRYLQWTAGSGKSLTINQMISILLIQKETSNWQKSLEVVPRRKLTVYPEKKRDWLENRMETFKYRPRY